MKYKAAPFGGSLSDIQWCKTFHFLTIFNQGFNFVNCKADKMCLSGWIKAKKEKAVYIIDYFL